MFRSSSAARHDNLNVLVVVSFVRLFFFFFFSLKNKLSDHYGLFVFFSTRLFSIDSGRFPSFPLPSTEIRNAAIVYHAAGSE